MTPIEFDGCNVVVAADQPPYLPLPGLFTGGPVGSFLTCWELTEEELAEVVRTRRIWNSIMTFDQPLQPHCLSTDRPKWNVKAELFDGLKAAVTEPQEKWKVVKVDIKGRVADKDYQLNLTENSAQELAQTLNTSRVTDPVHYFKAVSCGF